MIKTSVRERIRHRWYTRPVLFVADVNRALGFYIDVLGFDKGWHEGDGVGKVCQVNRDGCEIILCEDPARRDRGRLFVELTVEGIAAFRRELVKRSIKSEKSWWGFDVIKVVDPDGNELLFPAANMHGYSSRRISSVEHGIDGSRPCSSRWRCGASSKTYP